MSSIEHQLHRAIDHLTEGARTIGAETPMTDFLINYLAANIDDLTSEWEARQIELDGRDDA